MSKEGRAPKGPNAPGLTRITGPKSNWRCRVCKYGPIDKDVRNCLSCGRDWYGNPGTIPDDQPHRPGLRD